jgi:hypothetical protein
MSLSRRIALAAATLAAVASLSTSALAVDKRAEKAAADAIKKASSEYLATNYAAAAVRLQKAVRICGKGAKCSPGTKAALLRDLGTMQFRNGDVGIAKETWAQAFKAQADITLNPDYDTPDLRAAFEEARGGSGAMGEQPSGDFAHTPAGEQKVNTPLPIYVEYPGSAKIVRVTVKYKGAAMNDWARTDLKKSGNGWAGLIPCSGVTKGVLRYWIQGFDDGGDPAASSGDPKHPYAVPIKDEIAGEAPHLPGKPPPRDCSEDTDCPPGLPGCGVEEKPEGPAEEEGEAPPAGSYAKIWVGIAGALDFMSMPAGTDVCHLNPPGSANAAQPANSANLYCTNPDGSDFPRRNDKGQQNGLLQPGYAGKVDGGLQVGNVRVLGTFDYALSPALLVGARFGYVANAYTGSAARSDGRAWNPIDLELRGTYLFGKEPLANMGFAPMVFGGLGLSEFDGHVTTIVTLTTQEPINVWKTAGPFFLNFGGGVRYAFSLRAAFTAAARVNLAFGGGLLPTYGPELAIQYGF